MHYDFPGKARMCFNNVVLPFAWNESVKWGWESDFKREGEIEMFRLNRGYEGLVERINIEINDNYMVNNEDIPCGVIRAANDDYFDDIENKHLPGDRIGVLVADDDYVEMITYLTVKNHTKGDWTINDVDRFYDIIIWSNPVDYYDGIMNKTDLNLSLIHI